MKEPDDLTYMDSWTRLKEEEFYRLSQCPIRNPNASFHIKPGCFNLSYPQNASNANLDTIVEYNCKLNCSEYPENPLKTEKPMFSKTFWLVFLLWCLSFNIFESTWGLLYGMTYAILGEKPNKFGMQRIWGTYGALVTSIMSAFALNKYGSETIEITYTPCFIAFAFWVTFVGINAWFFKVPHMEKNPTMAKDMFKLIKQPAIFLLFTVLFIMGFLWGAVDTFLFVFLRSLNASSWTLGFII